jgi:hypothetical protein
VFLQFWDGDAARFFFLTETGSQQDQVGFKGRMLLLLRLAADPELTSVTEEVAPSLPFKPSTALSPGHRCLNRPPTQHPAH